MSKHTDLRSVGPGQSTFLSEATDRLAPVERATQAAPVPAWQIALRRAAAALRRWRDNRDARRGLAGMDARSLRDIGISPEMAGYEGRKPFWQPVRDLRS